MLAGWFGLAFLVVALAGPDRDGGTAMGAFFNIGPIGAVIGFGIGVWLFVKFGLVARHAVAAPVPVPSVEPASAPSVGSTADVPAKIRISRPFAIAVVAIVGGLAWWGWYELIRSPYLTHGDMTLALQFRLPAGMAPPADPKDVEIILDEGGQTWPGDLNAKGWLGHQEAVPSFSPPFRCRTRRGIGLLLCRCLARPHSPGLSIFRTIPIPRRTIRRGFRRRVRPMRSS